jgi:hypothetical protein
MITRALCPGRRARHVRGSGRVVAVRVVAVEVEHPSQVSVPAAADRLNLRFAWKPVNGHGGGAGDVQHGAATEL